MNRVLFFYLLLFIFSSTFGQLNLKVQVESIQVLNLIDCDAGALDNSDFVFEFNATDNTPFLNSNNSPVMGSIGQCNFAVVNEIYASKFKTDPPARSTVAVSALPKGVNVEIEVTAYKNNSI